MQSDNHILFRSLFTVSAELRWHCGYAMVPNGVPKLLEFMGYFLSTWIYVGISCFLAISNYCASIRMLHLKHSLHDILKLCNDIIGHLLKSLMIRLTAINSQSHRSLSIMLTKHVLMYTFSVGFLMLYAITQHS